MTRLDLKLGKVMKRLIDCGDGNHKYVNKTNSYGQVYSECKICHDRQEGYAGGEVFGGGGGGGSVFYSGSNLGTISPGYQSGYSVKQSTFHLSTMSRFNSSLGSAT